MVAGVLDEIVIRLSDRPVSPETWDQIRDALHDPMAQVIDAADAGDPARLVTTLNALIRAWARRARREIL